MLPATPARRRALVIHVLGTEGQRLLYTLPNTGTTYDEAMMALEGHLQPKVNTVMSRHHFRQRAQRADETVPQYMAALRELHLTCQVERALQSSSMLTGAAAVHTVAPQKLRYQRDNRRHSDPATNRPPQRAQQKQRTCYRCGAATHLANVTDCPASQDKYRIRQDTVQRDY